jgi:hypothetical protein
MDSVVCWVCVKRIPAALAHEHHKRPQAVGGTDLDLESLCSGCHNNVHAIASMLSGPRASQAEDTVRAAYHDNPAAGRRCIELAIKVVRHMGEKESGQFKLAAHEDVEILLELPLAVKNALMLIGREARDPQTNRRLGLAGAARHILIEAVCRRFPALSQEMRRSAEAQRRRNPDHQYARPRHRVNRIKETSNVETAK